MGIHYIFSRCAFWFLIFCGAFVLLGSLAIISMSTQVAKVAEETGCSSEKIGGNTGKGAMPYSSGQAFNEHRRGTAKGVIYVLGGTQRSLRLKYRTASELFKKGGFEKIVVATSAGITEYDANLGRNMTNDEWTFKQLALQGVKPESISLISLKHSLFGTLREARTVRELCIEKGIDRLLLVCSTYHSRRVGHVFSSILDDTGVRIEIRSTDEWIGIRGLFVEKVKLAYYKYALIPFEQWSRKLT